MSVLHILAACAPSITSQPLSRSGEIQHVFHDPYRLDAGERLRVLAALGPGAVEELEHFYARRDIEAGLPCTSGNCTGPEAPVGDQQEDTSGGVSDELLRQIPLSGLANSHTVYQLPAENELHDAPPERSGVVPDTAPTDLLDSQQEPDQQAPGPSSSVGQGLPPQHLHSIHSSSRAVSRPNTNTESSVRELS